LPPIASARIGGAGLFDLVSCDCWCMTRGVGFDPGIMGKQG
jgi:hypothetical protein